MNSCRGPIFLIVGAATVAVDFCIYQAALAVLAQLHLAKAVGFISGTVFAYFANRFWTFGDLFSDAYSFARFGALYTCTLGLNIVVNASILAFFPGAPTLAFLAATACSATLNFLGMKYYVFKPNRKSSHDSY